MKSYNRIVIETGDFEQLKSVILAYGGHINLSKPSIK
jgi:hypothetical protein